MPRSRRRNCRTCVYFLQCLHTHSLLYVLLQRVCCCASCVNVCYGMILWNKYRSIRPSTRMWKKRGWLATHGRRPPGYLSMRKMQAVSKRDDKKGACYSRYYNYYELLQRVNRSGRTRRGDVQYNPTMRVGG